MAPELLQLLTIAGFAALASPLGGLIALRARSSTLLISLAVGFAGGVLLGTFAFEMLPSAREEAGLASSVAGFAVGFASVYALNLFVNRGKVAGDEADQHERVEAFHKRHRPRGSQVAVLAGGTSAEELIEGLSIGVGLAVDPRLGLLIGVAIVIDNVSEGLSIGELARAESGERLARRVMGWTSLIGVSLFISALAGWFLLRDLSRGVLGVLLAAGAGGMFYLTVTQLVPESARNQFQQSAALAAGAGFALMFVLASIG